MAGIDPTSRGLALPRPLGESDEEWQARDREIHDATAESHPDEAPDDK